MIIISNMTGSVAVGFTSRCVVYRNSVQSIPNVTLTKVQYNAKTYDNDSEFDIVTNYRFVATKAGYYHIAANTNFVNFSGFRASCFVELNGVIIIEQHNHRDTGGSHNSGAACAGDCYLDVGDYIEVFVYQTSGGALNLSNVAGGNTLSIHRFA